MSLFGSPDFGAGAMASLMFLVGFLAVFLIVGIALAMVFRHRPHRLDGIDGEQNSPGEGKRSGGSLRVLMYGSAVSLLATCLLPRPIFCLYYGRDRADVNRLWVEQGMSEEEVIAKYGRPHEKYRNGDGEEEWHYHTDTWGSGAALICVRFDRDGRVTGSSNH